MNYNAAYAAKRRSESQILDLISDGETVLTNGGPGLPNRFLQLLAQNATRYQNVRLCHPMRRETLPLEPELTAEANEGHIFHVSEFTFDKPVIEAVRAGRATYRPNHPSDSARFFPYEIDLLVVPASSMDRHGFFSLGAFGGWVMGFVSKARRLVLEVNSHQPRVLGPCQVHISKVEALFEANYPLSTISLAGMVPTSEEKAIAQHVAGVVLDGATLQAGVGQIPETMLKLLKEAGKKDLGVHSEAMFDSMADLYDAGVITNSRKTIHRNMFTFSLVVGSERIYSFIDDNPAAEMHDIAYVADPRVIARNHRPFSVNATIQIDLSGQCASETIGHQHYSGVGGQWSFHYGAALAEEGRAVITLSATGKGGSVSRIVPMLPMGSAVTISRNDIQYVATEFGIVNLKGTTLEERALLLISIAHPKFRDALERSAREDLKLLRRAAAMPGVAAQ
ncbi:acyl-CoA hydrolase [Rhodoligotrophos appendicifer]|uniref:acetyl-CoA hydrolase/transferase family protein n=1 Tax=Rhodoligotrophos appendicifer TaxID=987056 RepID=UPI0011859FCC|nr:acetyl-CoA hydrolase/transferase C-terminal domain-containing protein [Rhodoligotrophos appendicifer]